MIDDPLAWLDYENAVAAALSPGPKGRCTCGEDRDAAMTRAGRCYACDCRVRGAPVTEKHHLFGRRRPIIVELPAGEHRVIDAMRLARPRRLREPGGDTLANIAMVLMQLAELAKMQAAAAERRRAPQWTGPLAEILADLGWAAAEALIGLGRHLAARLGRNWQEDPEFPRWTP